eukprot:12006392-Karenia_brevis.AAC.1
MLQRSCHALICCRFFFSAILLAVVHPQQQSSMGMDLYGLDVSNISTEVIICWMYPLPGSSMESTE